MSSSQTLPLPSGLAATISETSLGRQGAASVVVLAGGQSVAIWHTSTAGRNFFEVYARLLGPDGLPAGPEFRVNTTKDLDQFLPRAVALADGGFVVVWHSVKFAGEVAQDGNPLLYGLFSQRFAADGSAVGGERAIAANMFRDPYGVDVVPLAGGGYVAIWERHGTTLGDTFGQGYFRVYGADGRPVDVAERPEPFFAGVEFGASVIALTGGGFAILKYHNDDLQNGASDFEVRVYSALGVQQGGAFAVSSAVLEENSQSLVALAGGGFVVNWQAHVPGDAAHVFVRVFDAAGQPAGPDLRLDAAVTAVAVLPVITALADGGFVASWTEGTGSGAQRIMVRAFSADGQPAFAARVVNTFEGVFGGFVATHSLHPLPGGEILVTWQERDGFYGRLLEPDGRLHPGVVTLVPGFYAARDLVVSVLADGRISVAFESNLTGQFGDTADAFVQTLTLGRFGGLQGGYTEAADARQLIGASASIHALGGDDVVFAGANGDTIYGDAGHDYLVGGRADDLIFGGRGNDTLAAGSAPDGDQTIADRLYGGAGDDVLISVRGADRLYGGAGNDRFLGIGFGNLARIYGGDGDDMIRSAAERVYGGAGNDTIRLGIFGVIVDGGAGIDTLLHEYESLDGGIVFPGQIAIDLTATASTSGGGVQRLSGFENVVVLGNTTARIFGSDLDNRLDVNSGGTFANADLLDGRGGNDTLMAGAGNDTLIGGAGQDVLAGQSGADVFEFADSAGFDTIVDFQDGVDRILLRKGIDGITGPGGVVEIVIADDGADTVITFRSDAFTSIRLVNFDHLRLTDADFIYL